MMRNESERIRSRPMTMPQLDRWIEQRSEVCRRRKSARILARQIARSEHYIKARPLLRNGKAWR